ncbi:hypothetical protein MY876_05455 [Haemophilus influenzae]
MHYRGRKGVTEWYLDKASAKNLDIEMLLVKRYQDIFKENQEIIDALLSNSNLSKIHLGFVPDDFKKKKHRILIVGRETRGWDLKYLEKYDQNSVYQLMDLSKSWVIRNLERSDSVNKKENVSLISLEKYLKKTLMQVFYGQIYSVYLIKNRTLVK